MSQTLLKERKELYSNNAEEGMRPEATQIAKSLISAGATRVLVVGGGAISHIMEEPPSGDIDIEVFGLDYDQIKAVVPGGKDVGRAFGIVKTVINGVDIDINVPRIDNSVGRGHKDFVALQDPGMSEKEAARRRDLTINTLAIDLITGQVIDEWNGRSDLQKGILRATDPSLFIQDPLRVLRVMQLLPRKGKIVDPTLMKLCTSMVGEFPFLAKERVFEEFKKLLLRAKVPSVGILFLIECGWIAHFPELANLMNCPQNPNHHPEGDVMVHSLLTVDAAAEIRHLVPAHQRLAFMFGALLHDVGKVPMTITKEMIEENHPVYRQAKKNTKKTTEQLLLTAHGHDMAGGPLVESFFGKMTNNKKVIGLTRAIVEQHMQPYFLSSGEAKQGAYIRLHNKMRKAGGDLLLIARQCQCDACATSEDWRTRSLSSGSPNWEHLTSQRCMDEYENIEANESLAEPAVMGRDLIAAGIKPGPSMGKLLKLALDIQYGDTSLSKEDILSRVLPA